MEIICFILNFLLFAKKLLDKGLSKKLPMACLEKINVDFQFFQKHEFRLRNSRGILGLIKKDIFDYFEGKKTF